MTPKKEYLEVVLNKKSDDYSGRILWPKSAESLAEFTSEEWMQDPIRCLNHFSIRNWVYLEGIYSNNSKGSVAEKRILFQRNLDD